MTSACLIDSSRVRHSAPVRRGAAHRGQRQGNAAESGAVELHSQRRPRPATHAQQRLVSTHINDVIPPALMTSPCHS